MFTIKRSTEYFVKAVSKAFNGEMIKIITWSTDINKAAKFETFAAAEMTRSALNYSDTIIFKN